MGMVFLLAFMGCKRSMLMIYGVQQPKIENYKSEKKTLSRYNLPTDEIIVFRDSTGIFKIALKGIVIPDAAFFDSKGYFMPYQNDSVDCNAGVSPFIESLAQGATYQVDSTFHIKDVFNELVYSDSKSALEAPDLHGDYDYFVMFFWAAYTGKLNKHKVYKWHSTLSEPANSGLNIRAYYVNVECQEFWGYSEADIPRFKFTD